MLLDAAGGIERWASRIIDLLRQESLVDLHCIYLLASGEPPAPPGGLFGWIGRWSVPADSALNRIELCLPDVPVLTCQNGVAELRERIAEVGLDLLIWLESRPLVLDCAGLAPMGVWYFSWGDAPLSPSSPPYWAEAAAGNTVATLVLCQDNGAEDLRELGRCSMPSQLGWRIALNGVEPLRLAGPFLLRHLLDALDPQTSKPSTRIARAEEPGPPPPGNLQAAAWMFRQALRTVSGRWPRPEPRWFVALRRNRELFRSGTDRFLPQAFREVPCQAGGQLADPFLVEDGGRHWLFVEEIPAGSGKGHLSVLEVDSAGATGPPLTVLDKPYHLSYPFVFRHNGEFFMLPETSANNTIELYRATRFPFEWKLEKVLLSGVRAVDTTPFFLDGLWYFWTTSARLGQETFLFWSTALDGTWNYHPRNPICSDARRARGAGPMFRAHGSLIRPAQDCSVRYGWAIALNRVTRISPGEYQEELIEVIPPDWRNGLLGTHTLCSNDVFEAIDGLKR